jgi:dihydrofolate reductase/thymidylate synthase
MKLSQFSIIVMIDKGKGISKNGYPPREDVVSWNQYKKGLTIGKGNNCIIMGRNTYEYIVNKTGKEALENRDNYVISTRLQQSDFNQVIICASLGDCLRSIANRGYGNKKYDDVFIIGGGRLFREAVTKYLYLCKEIYLSTLKDNYECDMQFPLDTLNKLGVKKREINKTPEYNSFIYTPEIVHQESLYLKILERLTQSDKIWRGDTEYRMITNQLLTFTFVDNTIPVLTSRWVDYKKVIDKLLDDLQNYIFNADDVGFRLRCGSVPYTEMGDYESQVENDGLIEAIQKLPKEGVHTIYLGENKNKILPEPDRFSTALYPPCPTLVKFWLSPNRKNLDMTVFFETVEFMVGLPDYIVYFSLLGRIVAHLTNSELQTLNFFFAECLLTNHFLEQASHQINNTPKPFPTLTFMNITKIRNLSDFVKSNLEVNGYDYWVKFNFSKI